MFLLRSTSLLSSYALYVNILIKELAIPNSDPLEYNEIWRQTSTVKQRSYIVR